MDKFFTTFEELIRRGIAPSMTFFVVALAGDYLRYLLAGTSAWSHFAEYRYQAPFLLDTVSDAALVLLAVLVVIGSSYALMSLQQVLFDHSLKRNFNVWPKFERWRHEDSDVRALEHLRTQVEKRIADAELAPDCPGKEPAPKRPRLGLGEALKPSDYVLYEIVGGIDPTDTRGFVDSAKAIGIVFVSFMLVLAVDAPPVFAYLLGGHETTRVPTGDRVLAFAVTALLVGVTYVLGRKATAAIYRARALRLYVNFLAMPANAVRVRLLRLQKQEDKVFELLKPSAAESERRVAGSGDGAAPAGTEELLTIRHWHAHDTPPPPA